MTTPSFRLTGLIESGELADLYRATSAERGEVVIKLFHERTSDAHYARSLVTNSGVLNQSVVPGVVHWVDVGFVQRRLAVAREHVEGPLLGEALQKLHAREVLLPPPLALLLVLEVLQTIQSVHEAGVVHGAITPGNVLLSQTNGAPAVFDFGALHALMAVPQLKKTFVGRGRSAYRAPEVARGESPDGLSDIYSIGALAYELLTLHEPRVPEGLSTRRESLPPPSRVDRRLNARLDPILLRALDPQPHRRFKSCADFAAGLRNFLTSAGGLPAMSELKAFVDEVGTGSRASGPIPFTDFFQLEGIDGIELPEVKDGLPTVDNPRPSFTARSLSEEAELTSVTSSMDTIEAPPAFAEFKGVRGPPNEAEGTDPGGAGPLELGWDAPSSQYPVIQSRKRGPGLESTVIRQLPRNPRVKVVEDFQGVRPDTSPEVAATPPPVAQKPAARTARPAPAPPRPPAASAAPDRSKTPPNPMPPPGANIGPASSAQVPKYSTGEQHVRAIEKRQRRGRKIALSVAAVGVVCFLGGIAVVATREEPPPPPKKKPVATKKQAPLPPTTLDPKVRALSNAIARIDSKEPEPDEPAVAMDKPPPESKAGFITLRTNVPARVYVDGYKVQSRTPLERYPVWPGERKIEVEDPKSGERRVFRVTVRKGKSQSFNEMFGAKNP